ncbi:MAG: type II secretion system protein [Bacilli bacterium]|nr:type II secretion system protein [Bacilli bacterium]
MNSINNKGFTLIELIGVIVVLVAIFLVAFPSLLGTTKQDEEKLYTSMVDDLCLAGETYIYSNIDDYPELSTPNSTIYLNISNLIKDGSVSKNKVNPKTKEKINNHFITFDVSSDNSLDCEYIDTSCLMTNDIDGDALLDIGDEVTCGTESFYVIPNDTTNHPSNTKISLLTKYNLNVGSNPYPDGTIGVQNENVVGYKNGMTTYGNMSFSDLNYWNDEDGNLKSEYGSSIPAFVYDENSKFYTFVENYESILKTMGVEDVYATLPSYEQLVLLGCKDGEYCNTTTEEWVYSTNYRLGSGHGDGVMNIDTTGYIANNHYSYSEYVDENYQIASGIRPVIIIAQNDYLKADTV